MRIVTIIRKKRFFAALTKINYFLDGTFAVTAKNGEKVNIEVDNNEHQLDATSWSPSGDIRSETAFIPAQNEKGSNEIKLTLQIKNDFSKGMKLSFLNDENSFIKNISYLCQSQPERKIDNHILSGPLICAIIYTIVLGGISFFVYNIGETHLVGFLFALFFSVSAGIAIVLGGWYYIIVPLPFIWISKIVGLKPNQPVKRKVFLGLAWGLSPLLIFGSLYLGYILM